MNVYRCNIVNRLIELFSAVNERFIQVWCDVQVDANGASDPKGMYIT